MDVLKKEEHCYLGIDIGGTWLKGCDERIFHPARVKSPLSENATVEDFIESIRELVEKLGLSNKKLSGVGISTPGIVDYQGKKVLKAAAHLAVLKNENWIRELEEKFDCPVVLITDSDAAAIGIAEAGLLTGDKAIGIMPIGTGLGLTVWLNGRRWRPAKILTLLGSIRTPAGMFDKIASASGLAAFSLDNNLVEVLTNPTYSETRLTWLNNLVNVINTAAILYNLEEVMICGGLADAVNACNYPLETELRVRLSEIPVELNKPVGVTVLKEGNRFQLTGAISLAKGESVARANRVVKKYKSLKTESPYQPGLQLKNLPTQELLELFWKAEQEAGELLFQSIPLLTTVVEEVSNRVKQGGRIIYVGAGTSGRMAAMDAVEINCTYGFPADKMLSIVSGGMTHAAMEIESDFEEDASAVPELLFMNLKEHDVVIGISASGSAYYVQSALAFAKSRCAYTVMIQCELPENALPFCDITVPLHSGSEVVAGSTRMKAGTATKKILNFLSSSVMIRMGKVEGSYMSDMACINDKLVERAQRILVHLFNIDKEEAIQQLKAADMHLNRAIARIKQQV
jgi:N-acetylmuramic acid 6-phosphate etherase